MFGRIFAYFVSVETVEAYSKGYITEESTSSSVSPSPHMIISPSDSASSKSALEAASSHLDTNVQYLTFPQLQVFFKGAFTKQEMV